MSTQLRIISVMVKVGYTCPECGGEAVALSTAALLPDGRIGEPDPLPDKDVIRCGKCRDAAYEESARQIAEARARDEARREWAEENRGIE